MKDKQMTQSYFVHILRNVLPPRLWCSGRAPNSVFRYLQFDPQLRYICKKFLYIE